MALRVSDTTFRRLTAAALASLCVIVVSGAAVRLTGSGLGCEDWPNCNSEKLIDVSSSHTAIEQINRLFTGVVSISVILAVLAAHGIRPFRRDLVWLAWSLVIGVLAQIVIGGVVVLTGLHPLSNMAHFLVSMVLVACAYALHKRALVLAKTPFFRITRTYVDRYLIAMVIASAVTIVLGTVVTATGPHAGDENAPRFGFELRMVVQTHSVFVLLTLALMVMLYMSIRSLPSGTLRSNLDSAMNTLVVVTLAQAGVGYWQYFTGVPAGLVALHIAGATAFWLATCNLVLQSSSDVSQIKAATSETVSL
jgi:cytochrome c oxidase assembly protein subunit 15